MHFFEVNPCKLRDYRVTEMFMCFRRCSCFEPSDPTNGTLKYWEMNNVTVSEIYWEALEVKVLSTLFLSYSYVHASLKKSLLKKIYVPP